MATIATPSLLASAYALQRAGKLSEARASYESVLREAPANATALNNLAAILVAQGEFAAASALLARLVAQAPANATYQANLGHALLREGRAAEAVGVLESALRLVPGRADTLRLLGLAYADTGSLAQAERALERSVELAPGDSQSMNAYVDALVRAGKLDEAANFLRTPGADEAIVLDRRYKLGYVLMLRCDFAGARIEFEAVARMQPEYAPTFLNLASMAYWEHDAAQSEALLKHALALAPRYVEAHENLGYLYLSTERFDEGWPLCEIRTSLDAPARVAVETPQPGWDGASDPATTLVVCPEQGLGDVLQFARFLPQARQRVGRLVAFVAGYWSTLRPLLARIEGVDEVVSVAPRHAGVSCAMGSLPHLLGVGSHVESPPYLHADAAAVEHWRDRLGTSRALQVGVCWAGSSHFGGEHRVVLDRRRSIDARAFAPIVEVAGAQYHSLDPRASNAGALFASHGVRDWSRELTDMGETAALISALDLVITVDTAVAHVAGGLGKPVWLLNRFDTDWRWGFGGSTTRWYASMTIFRQTRLGEWNPVLAAVRESLRERVTARRGQTDAPDGDALRRVGPPAAR